jgi:hypothetical protein
MPCWFHSEARNRSVNTGWLNLVVVMGFHFADVASDLNYNAKFSRLFSLEKDKVIHIGEESSGVRLGFIAHDSPELDPI